MSKAIVLYNSRGGNTKKVAQYIAEGLIADIAENKKVPKIDNYNLIVVGSWVMFGTLSFAGARLLKKIRRKIKTNKKVVLFFTSGSPDEIHPFTENKPEPKTIKELMFGKMEKILSKNNNITILEDRYYCRGAMRQTRHGEPVQWAEHPTKDELQRAKDFGKQLSKYLA